MLAPEGVLPPVGYGIPEVERILGIPTKTGYKLVKEGKLEAFVDSTGKLRVGLTRFRGPIRVKRLGSVKGVKDGQKGQALLA